MALYRCLLTGYTQHTAAPIRVPLNVYLSTVTSIDVLHRIPDIGVDLAFRRTSHGVAITVDSNAPLPDRCDVVATLAERVGGTINPTGETVDVVLAADAHLLDVANRALHGPPWYDRSIVEILYE